MESGNPSSLFGNLAVLGLKEIKGKHISAYSINTDPDLGILSNFSPEVECLERNRSPHSVSQFRFNAPIWIAEGNGLYFDRLAKIYVTHNSIMTDDSNKGPAEFSRFTFNPEFIEESGENTVLRVLSVTPSKLRREEAEADGVDIVMVTKEQDLFQPTNVNVYLDALKFQSEWIRELFQSCFDTNVPQDVPNMCSQKLVFLNDEISRIERKFDHLLRYR